MTIKKETYRNEQTVEHHWKASGDSTHCSAVSQLFSH